MHISNSGRTKLDPKLKTILDCISEDVCVFHSVSHELELMIGEIFFNGAGIERRGSESVYVELVAREGGRFPAALPRKQPSVTLRGSNCQGGIFSSSVGKRVSK